MNNKFYSYRISWSNFFFAISKVQKYKTFFPFYGLSLEKIGQYSRGGKMAKLVIGLLYHSFFCVCQFLSVLCPFYLELSVGSGWWCSKLALSWNLALHSGWKGNTFCKNQNFILKLLFGFLFQTIFTKWGDDKFQEQFKSQKPKMAEKILILQIHKDFLSEIRMTYSFRDDMRKIRFLFQQAKVSNNLI